MLENSHSSYQHNIPDPSSMNICKSGSGSALMSDTSNGARKTRRLIIDQVHEAVETLLKEDSDFIHVLEFDCWNHLINLWIMGITNSLSTLLGNTLRKELDGIDSRLRVSTSIEAVLRAVDK